MPVTSKVVCFSFIIFKTVSSVHAWTAQDRSKGADLHFQPKNVRVVGAPPEDSAAIKRINSNGFKKHLAVLASDSFAGRKPFTKGETLTINYIAEQYKKLGAKPAYKGSYLQPVPMVEITSEPKPEGLQIVGSKKTLRLNFKDDFVAITRRVRPSVSLESSKMVFAGYGISAPQYGWDDYAGIDVKGKTVLVMVNDPGYFEGSLFKGKNMTYYGRWTYKYEEAARRGAAGLFIIHQTGPASYPWSVVRSSNTGAKLHLQTTDDDMGRAAVEGWMTEESAKKIFAMAGVDSSLMTAAARHGFKAVELNLSANMSLANKIKKATSYNVVSIVPGTSRPGEYIVYTAHWDHLGTGEAVRGDSVYNGAIDNATGCAALLQLAEAFSQKRSARSVVFLAVTAEEQGLLGSEYYASHPLYPLGSTVANINMDAMSADGLMNDIAVVGYGQSELDEEVKISAGKQHRKVTPDPHPSTGSFFRSDHFNFAKAGVPALYTESGTESTEHGAAWGKAKFDEYVAKRYHQPADNFEADKWDLSGMVMDTRLFYDVGYRLANTSSFPKWKKGSEFKSVLKGR